MTKTADRARRSSRLRAFWHWYRQGFREQPGVMSSVTFIYLAIFAGLYLQIFTNAFDLSTSLDKSTHVMQHESSQGDIKYVDPCIVLSRAQAEDATGATLHTYTNKSASYKIQDPSCYYTTASADALGGGAFAPGATAFQIDTFRESPAGTHVGFDGRQDSAKLSLVEIYVPIDVAAQPELKGATAAFYEFGHSTSVASGITFTVKGVTVSIWEQPATQQDLLNIAKVAINNFG